jgi:hypothetical protein
MPDKPEVGRLLISQSPGQTRIEGVVGASPDLMAVVGTVKEASTHVITDPSQLERAIVDAAQSGTKVMDGYIKFAQPVVLNAPTQITAGEAWLTKKAGETSIQISADERVSLNDLGFFDFLQKAAHVQGLHDKDCIEKAAACDFVENWLKKVELDKVDGNEVGLTVPVKVAFSDNKARDWFLSLFPKKAGQKKAAADNLAERLVAAGVKKAELIESLSKLQKRSAAHATS